MGHFLKQLIQFKHIKSKLLVILIKMGTHNEKQLYGLCVPLKLPCCLLQRRPTRKQPKHTRKSWAFFYLHLHTINKII